MLLLLLLYIFFYNKIFFYICFWLIRTFVCTKDDGGQGISYFFYKIIRTSVFKQPPYLANLPTFLTNCRSLLEKHIFREQIRPGTIATTDWNIYDCRPIPINEYVRPFIGCQSEKLIGKGYE